MDTLKSLLNPGRGKDDEVLYGSGQHAPSKGFSGEGSHFPKETSTAEPTTSTTAGVGSSTATDEPVTSSTTGLGSSTTGHSTSTKEPLDSAYSTGAGSSTTGLSTSTPTSTNAPLGNSTAAQTGTSGQRLDENASVASIKSGVHGRGPTSDLTEYSAVSGEPNTNKALPQTPENGATTGTGAGVSSLPDRNINSSSDPSAGIAAIGTTSTDRSFPLGSGSSTSTHLGGDTRSTETSTTSTANPSTGLTGASTSGRPSGSVGTSTTGPEYGSTTNPTSTPETSHTGRDAALGAGALGAAGVGATTLHHHRGEADRVGAEDVPAGTASPEYAPTGGKGIGGTLRAGPHPTFAGNEFDPSLYGKDGKLLSSTDGAHGTSSTTGAGPASTTGLGTSSTTTGHNSSTDRAGTTAGTAGPHSSNLLNKLDPRVDSDGDGSKTIGGTQAGTQQTSTAAAPSSASTGIASGSTEGTSQDENPYSATAVDPRVDDHPHSTTSGTSTGTKDDHLGRDTALVGGGTGLAAGAYEADKHHRESTSTTGPSTSITAPSTSTTGTSTSTTGRGDTLDTSTGTGGSTDLGAGTSSKTTQGPHKSSLLNKLDPRVRSGKDEPKTAGAVPASEETSTAAPTAATTSDTTGTTETHGDHRSRDAAVLGTGAGLGAGIGAEAYESNEHSTGTQPTTSTQPTTGASTGTSTAGPHTSDLENRADPKVDTDSSTTKDTQHHTGRDAALAGGTAAAGGATAVHEHDKHAAEKAEKQQLKEAQKEDTAAQKVHDKEAKHHEHEHEHEHEKSEKKHHGLLGFLHRDKTPKDDGTREAENQEIQKRLDENVGAGHGHHSTHTEHAHGERNRLHKEPPAEIKAQQESMMTEPTTGLPMDPKSGTGEGGTDGAPIKGISQDHPPTSSTAGTSTRVGHDSSTATTEPTGTTGPHSSSLENKLDPRVSDRDAVSTEPGNSGLSSSSPTATGAGIAGTTETTTGTAATRDPAATGPSVLESETGVESAHGSKGGAGHY